MTRHYSDLCSASDWFNQISHVAQPIRSNTQIWVVTHHQYGNSALVSQMSFGGETIGSFAKINVGCFLRLPFGCPTKVQPIFVSFIMCSIKCLIHLVWHYFKKYDEEKYSPK